jgi:hypothetical protein
MAHILPISKKNSDKICSSLYLYIQVTYSEDIKTSHNTIVKVRILVRIDYQAQKDVSFNPSRLIYVFMPPSLLAESTVWFHASFIPSRRIYGFKLLRKTESNIHRLW